LIHSGNDQSRAEAVKHEDEIEAETTAALEPLLNEA
jgi:hypothetical protein